MIFAFSSPLYRNETPRGSNRAGRGPKIPFAFALVPIAPRRGFLTAEIQ
jgi:hypothetical protein